MRHTRAFVQVCSHSQESVHVRMCIAKARAHFSPLMSHVQGHTSRCCSPQTRSYRRSLGVEFESHSPADRVDPSTCQSDRPSRARRATVGADSTTTTLWVHQTMVRQANERRRREARKTRFGQTRGVLQSTHPTRMHMHAYTHHIDVHTHTCVHTPHEYARSRHMCERTSTAAHPHTPQHCNRVPVSEPSSR
jgi:hypothetical protein